MSVGENTKIARSPLLPIRHQPDFFVCDIVDAAFKGDQTSMEHPVFSLSKKPDMKTRRYENGDKWMEIVPSGKGMATVFDRDILIYCISQLTAAINDERPVHQNIRLRAHDLLIATNRDTSGRGYQALADALSRLRGTEIVTNIPMGTKIDLDGKGLIESYKITRENRANGRMIEIEIKLSDWLFEAAMAQEVLTLSRRYFQLAKPLERRLYEIARKHVGQQSEFRIGIEKLQAKCGSQSTLKEFKRLLQTILADDQEHDHLPDYSFTLNGSIVEIRPKSGNFTPTLPGLLIRLSPAIYETGRALAPGWDIHTIESEWRAWIEKKGITPRRAEAHFLAFCKRRGQYPGFIKT
jgi:Replication initiator protein A